MMNYKGYIYNSQRVNLTQPSEISTAYHSHKHTHSNTHTHTVSRLNASCSPTQTTSEGRTIESMCLSSRGHSLTSDCHVIRLASGFHIDQFWRKTNHLSKMSRLLVYFQTGWLKIWLHHFWVVLAKESEIPADALVKAEMEEHIL